MTFKIKLTFLLLCMSQYVLAQIDYVSPRDKIEQSIDYYQEGNYAKAQNLLKSFSTNDSFYELSGTIMYLTHTGLSEYDDALKTAERFAKDLTIDSREDFYKRAGEAAFYGKFYQRGIDVLKDGLIHFNKDVNLYDYLGKNYMMLGEDSLAYEACLTGLKINPFHPGLLENFGELNAIHGNYTQSGMAWYIALFSTYHNVDDYGKGAKTSDLMTKFQSVLGGTYDRGLFPFNWDGKEDSKEEYKDLKIPSPVSKSFIISNYYGSTDELLTGEVAINARYKARSKLNYKFAKQTQMMGDVFAEGVSAPRDKNEDWYVYHNLLENFIGKMTQDKKHLTHFQNSIMALFYGKYNSKMVKKYKKKAVPINREFTKIVSESMRDMPIEFNGKEQKVNRRFSASTFKWYGVGDLKDAAGTDEFENREGVWEYYFDNGKVESRGVYKDGKKEGSWDDFDQIGRKANSYIYDKGELTKVIEYEKNGLVSVEKNLKDFSLVDSLLIYYPDGAIKKWYYMPKGSKNIGRVASFHTNGLKEYEADIKYFDLQSKYAYSNNRGKEVFIVDFKNGKRNGVIKEYYSNGKLFVEGMYKDDDKDGKWQYYTRDGDKSTVISYSKGKLDGKQEYYNSKGQLTGVANYKNDELDGEQLDYQRNGKIELKTKYDDGSLKEVECFDETGKSIYKKSVGNSTTTIEIKHPNGVIKSKGTLKEGKKAGKWEYFSEFGVLTRTAEYSKGKLDGKVVEYYTSGIKYAEYFAKEDKNEGKYIGFYSNGKKSAEGFFKDDEKVGEWLYFYPDGTLEDKSYYVEGDVYGFQYDYDVTGKLNYTNYVKDDWAYYRVSYDSIEQAIDTLHYVTPVSSVYYNLNVLGDTTFVSPLLHNELHGVAYYYPGKVSSYALTYDEGDLDKTFEIKDALGHVTAKKTYELGEIQTNVGYNGYNGKVTFKGSYKNGNLHGKVYDYYPDGTLKLETNYVDGEQDGTEIRYAPDGNIVMVMVYDDGDLISYGENAESQTKVDKPVVSIKYTYDNGKPKVDMTLKYGSFDGDWKIYNKNGTVGESRQYKLGNKNGVDTIYNKKGEILKIIPHKGGDTYGEVVEYDGNGKVVRKTNYVNDEKHGWEFHYKNGSLFKSFYYYNGDPIIEK